MTENHQGEVDDDLLLDEGKSKAKNQLRLSTVLSAPLTLCLTAWYKLALI